MMAFKQIRTAEDLKLLKVRSAERPQCIFKHSTRCSISGAALERVEREAVKLEEQFDFHLLDILTFRPLSNQIAKEFQVEHASPQVLVVHGGRCIYSASHWDIQPGKLLQLPA